MRPRVTRSTTMPNPIPAQLELFTAPLARAPEELHALLVRQSRRPVRLTVTQNAVSMVAIRFAAHTAHVRLNRAFLAAPDHVIEAVGEYLQSRSRAAWRTVGAFADTILPEARPARTARLATQGQVYDLAAIRDRVQHRYFGSRVQCAIGWGQLRLVRRRRARSRSIRFGCYVRSQNLVRINPLLDDPRVPAEFVEYIVFHEMLHAAVPSTVVGDRRRHHHAAFRTLERRYPNLPKMRKLSAQLVKLLAGP